MPRVAVGSAAALWWRVPAFEDSPQGQIDGGSIVRRCRPPSKPSIDSKVGPRSFTMDRNMRSSSWRAVAFSPAIIFSAQPARAAQPVITKTPLFEGGHGGYKLYRIPGIVVTRRGTILAYCEARKFTGGDWDTIDIELRRSTDGGQTFSEPQIIGRVKVPITRNPVAIE